MTNLELIRAERERQINREGWTEEHDDEYTDGELSRAAACYASPLAMFFFDARGQRRYLWPWSKEWDKRGKHDRKRQLVIAGALIVAELDRLDRIEVLDPIGAPSNDPNCPNCCGIPDEAGHACQVCQ